MIRFVFISLFLMCAVLYNLHAQGIEKAFEIGTQDTTYLAVNKAEGWSITGSYVKKEDSSLVVLEMIVRHARVIDWTIPNYVARITQRQAWPDKPRNLHFWAMKTKYLIMVQPDGRCYLKLEEGDLPDGDQVVVPIRIEYSGN